MADPTLAAIPYSPSTPPAGPAVVGSSDDMAPQPLFVSYTWVKVTPDTEESGGGSVGYATSG